MKGLRRGLCVKRGKSDVKRQSTSETYHKISTEMINLLNLAVGWTYCYMWTSRRVVVTTL